MSNLNVEPRTIFCQDNLDILRGMNSSCIDLIYLDPPFNKKKVFTAPIGSSAEGAEFSDIFREEDIKDEWVGSIEFENSILYNYLTSVKSFSNKYNYCYLVYMAIRLIECHRILKDTGSLYLHCDSTMSHYLKIVLDCVFGEKNFRNEIVWSYRTGGVSTRYFPKKHDIILLYGKSKNCFHFPVKELVLYDRPFFTGAVANKDGKFPVEVYVRDVWGEGIKPLINVSKERTGYPTQKPLALLERIIEASSNKGDMVLDPFCGCATTCIAAEKLGRDWIGIDVSIKAYELVKIRLEKEVPKDLLRDEPNFSTEVPERGEDEEKEKGVVYIISNEEAWPDIYKVGIAKDAKARLNSYQTSDPLRGYKLEFSLETPYFREIEKHIHNKFKNGYEWVKGNLTDIIQEIKKLQSKHKRTIIKSSRTKR